MDDYGLVKKSLLTGFLWTPKSIPHNGDVIPLTVHARALCSVEMLVGLMYLAAVVARLIGFTTQGRISRRGQDSQREPWDED